MSGVLTANDLLSGRVVYFTSSGDWSPHISSARVYDKDDSESALSSVDSHSDIVVGAYWCDVSINDDGVPFPIHFREQFRAVGFDLEKLRGSAHV